jgi:hypothetical protein
MSIDITPQLLAVSSRAASARQGRGEGRGAKRKPLTGRLQAARTLTASK